MKPLPPVRIDELVGGRVVGIEELELVRLGPRKGYLAVGLKPAIAPHDR